MTVSAPLRPPRRGEPAVREEFDAIVEALIEEARRRARRRRRARGVAACVAVLAGASVLAATGSDGFGHRALLEFPALAGTAVAEDESVDLIAHRFEMHNGFVLAYADGRVISQFDLGGQGLSPMFERRLAPLGVERVRSGAISPAALLRETTPQGDAVSPSSLPLGSWLESAVSTYVPSRYAVLFWGRPDDGPYTPLLVATRVVERLPEPLRAMLRGKERTYSRWSIFLGPDPYPADLMGSEVTAEEARILRGVLARFPASDGTNEVPLSGSGPTRGVSIGLTPIFPHGEWAMVGG